MMRPEQIAQNGAWLGTEELGHCFDAPLADALADFFADCTVGDFGCGDGSYVRRLRERGIHCDGFDGNQSTPTLSPGCGALDLSEPQILPHSYDWILCLEVGEHIPADRESVFLDNLRRHNSAGIVLSWAIPGQGGDGHVNCRTNEYICREMAHCGYAMDFLASQAFRDCASLAWFKRTLMVLRNANV